MFKVTFRWLQHKVGRRGGRARLRIWVSHLVLLSSIASLISYPTGSARGVSSSQAGPGQEICCDDEEAPPDEPDEDFEDVNRVTGYVHELYPGYDTSLATWYQCFPCKTAIGEEEEDPEDEPEPDVPDDPALPQELSKFEEPIYSEARKTPPVFGDLGLVLRCPSPKGISAPCPPQEGPFQEDPCSPFKGKDIIFVHGLRMTPLLDKLLGTNPDALTTWPQNKDEFYGDGYWKLGANEYWKEHIKRFLNPFPKGSVPGCNFVKDRAQNRFLIAAWPSTQTLDYGVHAVLKQIADAITIGKDVKCGLDKDGKPVDCTKDIDPRGTTGFCDGGCVIISHSAGPLLTDVAMSLAARTKTDPVLRSKLGPIDFIPERMKVHIAFTGAFSGSQYATAVMTVALKLASGITFPIFCNWATQVLNQLSGTQQFTCNNLDFLKDSVVRDLVPQVAQNLWMSQVAETYRDETLKDIVPPVLTVTGGHPTYNLPLKRFLARGFDDGVVTLNCQCANPNPASHWPSGFVPERKKKVFDKGIRYVESQPNRAKGYYRDQVKDRKYAPIDPLHKELGIVAAGCTPYISPTGMLQPVKETYPGSLFDPLNRYPKHYSFIMSASDHFYGPTGPYPDYLDSSGEPNKEEVLVITDDYVYTLVNPGISKKVIEVVRGKMKKKKKKNVWKWKRIYHLLEGWENMTAGDYVYQYVLR